MQLYSIITFCACKNETISISGKQKTELWNLSLLFSQGVLLYKKRVFLSDGIQNAASSYCQEPTFLNERASTESNGVPLLHPQCVTLLPDSVYANFQRWHTTEMPRPIEPLADICISLCHDV